MVETLEEGGYLAISHENKIFTQANTIIELREMIKDAVICHFSEENMPKTVKLKFVKEEILSI